MSTRRDCLALSPSWDARSPSTKSSFCSRITSWKCCCRSCSWKLSCCSTATGRDAPQESPLLRGYVPRSPLGSSRFPQVPSPTILAPTRFDVFASRDTSNRLSPHELLPSLPQKHSDAVGCPRGYTTPEEIGVFRPDWAPKGECRGQHGPILRISLAQPLSSFRFELAVHLASDQFHQLTQGAQECQRLFRIAAALDDERRQVFFGLGVCNFRNKERRVSGIFLD